MDRLNALADDLKHVAVLLAEDVLEPDPTRTDWGGLKVRVGMVREGMDRILEGLEGALEEAEEADLKARIRARVADLAGRTAALLHGSGNGEGARRMLEQAVRIAGEPAQRARFEAGLIEPEGFCLYEHAVWRLGRGRAGEADELLRRVARESGQKALRKAARGTLRRGRPVVSAWQVLVIASLAGGLVWAGVHAYRTSPGRLARLALEEAQGAEATLSREEALERYRAVIDTHSDDEVQARAADAVVRLSLAGLPSPCTRDAVEAVGRVVTGIDSLPSRSYQGAPATRLGERLEACAQQIGHQTLEDTRAAFAVVEGALQVTPESGVLQAQRVALQRFLADRLVKDWPLQALALYAALPGREPLDAARAVLDTLGPSPSLWIESSTAVEAWLEHEDHEPSGRERVKTYRQRLKAARAAHERDLALIEEGDASKLRKALETSPGNQELTVAVANLARDQGDAQEALRLLSSLGPQGRLTADARMMLGVYHRDLGHLAEAEEVLSALVTERLAPFQRAQQRYEDAEREMRERLIAQADEHRLPRELRGRLAAASNEQEQVKLFHEWMSARMEEDPGLEKLRWEYLLQQTVVPTTLLLGTVKLQRANTVEGEARRALLGEAERLFLSIRQEAEGNPRYHLGLGQVYHRLGRTEDGDRELRGLLERKDPELSLEVAYTYRELDRIDEARRVSEEVFDTAPSQGLKHTAAGLLSRLAPDEEEEEKWLRASNPDSPEIRNDLQEVEAHRYLREGKLEEADRTAAKCVAFRVLSAKHDPVSANNAASALITRFEATGDPEHLRSAVRYQEDAVRLAPDNALVVGNLAAIRQLQGHLALLERWVRTQPLRLRDNEAQELLEVLLDSPLREEVLRAMATEPSLRRGLELSQQEQTLAPGKTLAWTRQLNWLRQHRDERGLAAMARRLEALPPFAGGTRAEARRKWESGVMDAQLSRWAAQKVARAEATVKRAEQLHHGPTLALAWHLLGEALLNQRSYDSSPEKLDTMVDAYRRAGKLWPVLGATSHLERVLARVALERGAAKSEALAKIWKEEQRKQGTTVMLHHALSGPSGAEVAAVLRAQPELKEAAEHARQRARVAPEVADWVLAKAAGDVVLEQAAAAVFARPDVELHLALDARLSGGHPREQAEHELFRQGKALQGRP